GTSGARGASGAAAVDESSAGVGAGDDGGLAQWGAAAAVGATAGLAGVAAVLSRTKSRAWGEQVTEALTEREPSEWDRLKRIVRQAKQS
ncbi:MAG TPA: hypothetical protein PLV92_30610, partial [Pirellulaceae bacterium]|nr:hypothetical protein [Pirellulaceae bacterium]